MFAYILKEKQLSSTFLFRLLICGVVSLTLCSACQSAKTPKVISSASPSAIDGVSYEYIIGPEDVLEINVWKNTDLSRTVLVRPDGMITLPLIGEVQAGGNTPNKLRKVISARLEKYKEAPEVTVTVSQINSYNIYILGEVRNPGKYQIKSYATVLQAVALAGGFTQWAEKNDMVILRKTPSGQDQKIAVRYKDVFKNTKSNLNELLHPGDTLIVP